MSLVILFNLSCAKHVSDINIQLQQGDKTHHTKHTTTHRKYTLIAKTSVFTEQDDRCGNLSTQSQAPEDGYINPLNTELNPICQ